MVPRHHTSPSTTARRLLRHLHPRRDTGTGSGQKVKLIGIRRLPRLRRPRLAAPHLASRAATKEAVEAAALPRAQYRKRLRRAQFCVDDFVLGLFRTAGMRNRTFVECGANDGRYSHTRLFEAKLGWCGGCIEASPPNFIRLQRSVTTCMLSFRGEVLRLNVTIRTFPHTHHLSGHSGLVSMRSHAEWGRRRR